MFAKLFNRSRQTDVANSDTVPPAPPEEEPVSESPPDAFRDYDAFCALVAPRVEAYCRNFQERLPKMSHRPLISVVLPVFNPDVKWLQAAIDSVRSQIYPDWQLCIADDASPNPEVRETLEHYREADKRIQVVYRKTNGHISEASNSALELATGEFVALLDHDDRLAPHALARVVDTIVQHPDVVLIYTDEDKIDEDDQRSQPHFKSDWNPDLLLGQNFISHLGVYRLSHVEALGGFRKGYEGAQDWDLALRITTGVPPSRIQHIPEALYHWRSISGSTATDIDEKSYAHEAARRVLADYFDSNGINATLEPVDRYYWRPKYRHSSPRAAIVIPTRDRVDLLKACVDSVTGKTGYPNYQIVVANNESVEASTLQYFSEIQSKGIVVVDTPGEFNFSRIANEAIRSREEEIIILLNNDTTIINGDWIEELVMHASREEIGPVGAKLLFPHDHVQHAGIVLGIGGIGSEAFKYIHKTDDGYIHRAFLIGNYSAVTGACMAFRKSVWLEAGEFDEVNTPNAYSDVDFCLRCHENGYRTLFTPFAQLYHAESASRGPENSTAFQRAMDYMNERWATVIERDPYYNPNLTLEREDFTFAREPRGYSTR